MDGIEDLAYSSGKLGLTGGLHVDRDVSVASTGSVLFGGESNALQKNSDLSFTDSTGRALYSVGVAIDDLTDDNREELIYAGAYLESVTPNNSRTMGVYESADGELIRGTPYTFYIIDGKFNDIGNGPFWESNNGLDQYYNSQLYAPSNIAAVSMEINEQTAFSGEKTTYLYVDSILYQYTDGSFTMSQALDEQNDWLGKQYSNQSYIEYGATAADIDGTITGNGDERLLASSRLVSNLNTSYASYTSTSNNALNVTSVNSDNEFLYPVMLNSDNDTILIEYTGNSYLTYSNPELLAVIAAAPYFEDVDRVVGGDYAWQNTTSWASTEGEGNSFGFEFEGFLGVQGNIDATAAGATKEYDFNAGVIAGYSFSNDTMIEYTLEFETSQDEDAVAFYSIPTQNYEYIVKTPTDNGGFTEETIILTNPLEPNYQVLRLDLYEQIQNEYSDILVFKQYESVSPGEYLKTFINSKQMQ